MISGPFFIGPLVGVGSRMTILGPRLGTPAGTLKMMPIGVPEDDHPESEGHEAGDVAGNQLNNAPEWAGRLWIEWTGDIGRSRATVDRG